MDATPTRRATDGQQAEGSSRSLPHRIDQGMLWRDLRQMAVFVGGFVALGIVSYLLAYAGVIG